MRWVWLQKTDRTRPSAAFDIAVPATVSAMFAISVTTLVGDGKSTLFWTDRWLHGQSISDLAPDLMPFVRKRGWRALTVDRAMESNTWLRYIVGGLSTRAYGQFFRLWDLLHDVTLQPGTDHLHRWTPRADGCFSTKSAYERFFLGATSFEPYK